MSTYSVTLTLKNTWDSSNIPGPEQVGDYLILSQTSAGDGTCANPPEATNSAELQKFCTQTHPGDVIEWLGASENDEAGTLAINMVTPNSGQGNLLIMAKSEPTRFIGVTKDVGKSHSEDYHISFTVVSGGNSYPYSIDPIIAVNPR